MESSEKSKGSYQSILLNKWEWNFRLNGFEGLKTLNEGLFFQALRIVPIDIQHKVGRISYEYKRNI